MKKLVQYIDSALRVVYVFWFISCLVRSRWLICGSCVLGICVTLFGILKGEKKNKLRYLISLVFFAAVIVANIWFVFAH